MLGGEGYCDRVSLYWWVGGRVGGMVGGRTGGNDPIRFYVIIFQHTHVFLYRYIRYIEVNCVS